MCARFPIRTTVAVLLGALSVGCAESPAAPLATPQPPWSPAPTTIPTDLVVASPRERPARLMVTGPALDSLGARVPYVVTLFDGGNLPVPAMKITASGGARVGDCTAHWGNPQLRSVSRLCHVLMPAGLATVEVLGELTYADANAAVHTLRSPARTFRPKGPRSAPVSFAEAERIAECGNDTDDVWLTFDDVLPSAEVARAMVAVLDRNRVRGRFFLNRVTAQTRRILESSGHLITNHTRDHLPLSDLSDSEIVEQVAAGPATTAGSPRLLRPSYGAGAWSARVVEAIAAAGHVACRWTVDSQDYAERTPAQMAAAMRWGDAYTPPVAAGGVVVMHATHFSAARLQAVIDAIRARGLTPEPRAASDRSALLPGRHGARI